MSSSNPARAHTNYGKAHARRDATWDHRNGHDGHKTERMQLLDVYLCVLCQTDEDGERYPVNLSAEEGRRDDCWVHSRCVEQWWCILCRSGDWSDQNLTNATDEDNDCDVIIHSACLSPDAPRGRVRVVVAQ